MQVCSNVNLLMAFSAKMVNVVYLGKENWPYMTAKP